MIKKILAAAIVSAFAAPAFAATANVDVYGKLHMSFSHYDDQVSSAKDQQISSNASRIGFKGAEDLGGGLAAIWQIESGINLDETGGTWAGRNSFVGLKGGFGTALIGNNDTPLKNVGRKVDLFGDTVADSRNVNGVGGDMRAKNVAAYISPSFGGFEIAAAYSTDPAPTSTSASVACVPSVGSIGTPSPTACTVTPGVSGNLGDAPGSSVYSLSATYTNGPLFVGLGYGDGDGHEAAGLGKHMRAAAGFEMGALKLVGQYDMLEDDNANSGQPGDFDAWMAGAAFTMGNVVLKGNYLQGEYDGANGYDVEQWTVGADYNLSKRTSAYVLYSTGENVTMGKGAGISDQVAPSAGGDISVVSLGMIHSF